MLMGWEVLVVTRCQFNTEANVLMKRGHDFPPGTSKYPGVCPFLTNISLGSWPLPVWRCTPWALAISWSRKSLISLFCLFYLFLYFTFYLPSFYTLLYVNLMVSKIIEFIIFVPSFTKRFIFHTLFFLPSKFMSNTFYQLSKSCEHRKQVC